MPLSWPGPGPRSGPDMTRHRHGRTSEVHVVAAALCTSASLRRRPACRLALHAPIDNIPPRGAAPSGCVHQVPPPSDEQGAAATAGVGGSSRQGGLHPPAFS